MIEVERSGDYTTIRFKANYEVMFAELVHRATNLWPDAPAEIKHFADLVIHGKPMQDYFSNPHLAGKVHSNQSDKA